jgi:hypothetical protein
VDAIIFEFLCFFGEASETFFVYEKKESRNQPGLFAWLDARFILCFSIEWCSVIVLRVGGNSRIPEEHSTN